MLFRTLLKVRLKNEPLHSAFGWGGWGSVVNKKLVCPAFP